MSMPQHHQGNAGPAHQQMGGQGPYMPHPGQPQPMGQPHPGQFANPPMTNLPATVPTMYYRERLTINEPQPGQQRSWTSCRREKVHAEQEELRERVKKNNKTSKFGDEYIKTFKSSMSPPKKATLDQTLNALNMQANPMQLFKWQVAYLKLNNEEATTRGKRERFTRSMDVVYRRIPRGVTSGNLAMPMQPGMAQAFPGQPQGMPMHGMPHPHPHLQHPHPQSQQLPPHMQHPHQPPQAQPHGPPHGHPAMVNLGPQPPRPQSRQEHPAIVPLGPAGDGGFDDDFDDFDEEDDFEDFDEYPTSPNGKQDGKKDYKGMGGKSKDKGKGKGKGKGKDGPVVHHNQPKVYAYSKHSDSSDSDSLLESEGTADTPFSIQDPYVKVSQRRNSSASGGAREHRRFNRPEVHGAGKGSRSPTGMEIPMSRPANGMNSRRPGGGPSYPMHYDDAAAHAHAQAQYQASQQQQLHQHLSEQARRNQEAEIKLARLEGMFEGMQLNSSAPLSSPTREKAPVLQIQDRRRRGTEYQRQSTEYPRDADHYRRDRSTTSRREYPYEGRGRFEARDRFDPRYGHDGRDNYDSQGRYAARDRHDRHDRQDSFSNPPRSPRDFSPRRHR